MKLNNGEAVGMKLPDKILTLETLQALSVLLLGFWALSPEAAYGDTFRVAAVALVGFWFACELVRFPGGRTLLTLETGGAVLLTVLMVGGLYAQGGASAIRPFIQLLISFVFLIMSGAYRKRGFHELHWIALPLFLIVGYYSITTLGAISEDSRVARDIVRSSAIARELSEQGIGGYSLVYCAIFTALAALALSLARSLVVWQRVAFGACAAISSGLVLQAGYSIAALILLFALALFMILRLASAVVILASIAGLLIVVLSVVLFDEQVTGAALALTEGTPYHRKVYDISEALFGRGVEASASVAERHSRYGRSLSLFVENPLGTFNYRDVGKHSQLLDGLALFGLLPGLLLGYLLAIHPVFATRSGRPTPLTIASGVASFLLILLNNFAYSIAFGLFIMVPLAVSIVTRRESGDFIAVPLSYLHREFAVKRA